MITVQTLHVLRLTAPGIAVQIDREGSGIRLSGTVDRQALAVLFAGEVAACVEDYLATWRAA